jgi:hypothetical protein
MAKGLAPHTKYQTWQQIPNTAMIVQLAIASFLYSEASGFADSKPGRGQ